MRHVWLNPAPWIDLVPRLTALESPLAYSVLLMIVLKNHVDDQNVVRVPQLEIAQDLGRPASSVFVAYKKLLQADVIRLIRRGSYMLNPRLYFNGKPGRQFALEKLWDDLDPTIVKQELPHGSLDLPEHHG